MLQYLVLAAIFTDFYSFQRRGALVSLFIDRKIHISVVSLQGTHQAVYQYSIHRIYPLQTAFLYFLSQNNIAFFFTL